MATDGYPKTSRAAILRAYGEPLEVGEIDVPALEAGAILVEVAASTMCGTDVHMADGDYAEIGTSHLPIVMGHEIVGRIVALGGDVTDALNRPLALGDLIAWAYGWCDRCYWCTVAKQPTLCENRTLYGWGPADRHPYLTGGYAEYCYVLPICKPVRVPDGLDPRVAASATCPIRATDTVVIQGSGPVGLYALAWAIRMGARQTVCIGAPASRLAIAGRWGADHTVDLATTTVAERRELIRELTDGRGADLVVDCSGPAAAFEEGLDLIRNGGRYLVVGQAEGRLSKIHATTINMRQLTLVGSLSGDVSHYYRALQFLADNADRFDFSQLLGDTYGLHEVNEALASMRAARETKPVILPGATTA
jgi:D-arabinose 1-dehydrogenase-like Zn-dependent alcohol dehydrogenase